MSNITAHKPKKRLISTKTAEQSHTEAKQKWNNENQPQYRLNLVSFLTLLLLSELDSAIGAMLHTGH